MTPYKHCFAAGWLPDATVVKRKNHARDKHQAITGKMKLQPRQNHNDRGHRPDADKGQEKSIGRRAAAEFGAVQSAGAAPMRRW